MKLGDFLVDLAAVVSASRSVASKHVALRARQYDHYGKTSSIAANFRKPQAQRSDEKSTASSPAPAPQPRDAAEPMVKILDNELGRTRSTWPPTTGVSESTSGQDGLFSMRVGSLRPKSGPFVPHSPLKSVPRSTAEHAHLGRGRTRDPTSETEVSEFVPAPWASGGNIHQTSPAISQGRPKPTTQDRQDTTSLPGGIDVNVFRTRQGPKTLGSLSLPQEVNPHASANASQALDPNSPLWSLQQPKKSADNRSLLSDGQDEAREASSSTAEESMKPAHESAPAAKELAANNTGVESAESSHQRSTEDPASQLSQQDAELVTNLKEQVEAPTYQLRESKVPATRLSRLWNYSGLAAGMFAGAIGEGFSRAVGGGGQGSMVLSAANMERLVSKLSRMRGAALKLGQMMSFQDSKMLPAPIQEVLQRVQDRADYMPAWQRDRVLAGNLGSEWRDIFDRFDERPIAAASIGQVHRATLRSSGQEVAVKIQFPGVADSINSDLDNIGMLLAAARLLPKGLYLNKTIDNARTELGWECDYGREAACARRYRKLLSENTDVFVVPEIYPEASGKQVLTMEYMSGTGVTRVKSFTQEQRDWIGTHILRLCLREITEFKFMQTDPNWTNFLFNSESNKLELLDFGASREYPEQFIVPYVQLLEAASRSDRDAVKILSEQLGYLTGHESQTMLDAHIASVLTLAEPFLQSAPEVYDFRDQTITDRVKAQIPVMIRERLAPPPEETYSLHRKLSGAFLLCSRLGSRVRCRELFEQAVAKTDVLST